VAYAHLDSDAYHQRDRLRTDAQGVAYHKVTALLNFVEVMSRRESEWNNLEPVLELVAVFQHGLYPCRSAADQPCYSDAGLGTQNAPGVLNVGRQKHDVLHAAGSQTLYFAVQVFIILFVLCVNEFLYLPRVQVV
jgi:hypothetical protein